MFFYLSKILWVFTAPSNLLVVAVLGMAAAWGWRSRWRRVCVTCAFAFLIGSFVPLGQLLLVPLEFRFPRPDLSHVDPAGIIVLGGPISPTLGAAHGIVHLMDGAERLTAAVALARRYSKIPLIYTGGTNAIVLNEAAEATGAKQLWLELGIPAERILLEDRSRNTAENAQNTRVLLQPAPGSRYLLVTSAFHMPRSVGLFRRAGISVIPYPVDYRTTGTPRDWIPPATAGQGLGNLDFAVREWIGLFAYFLSGQTDELLPGPDLTGAEAHE